MRPPPDRLITSPANPTIKRIRSLQRRKRRVQERAFVLEGQRLLADAIDAGVRPNVILLREDYPIDRLPPLPQLVAVRWVTSSIFDELAETIHPQGVLAEVPIPEPRPQPLISPLTLVIDGLRDPGNLGTLLRSAAAAGVDQAIMTPETVDPFNAKAVRAGMGAQLRLPISTIAREEMPKLAQDHEVVALAVADGDKDYDGIDWTRSAVIIIGGEAFGPSSVTASVATVRTRIPLAGGIESLNAGVAGSVVLFEAARQRRRVAEAKCLKPSTESRGIQ